MSIAATRPFGQKYAFVVVGAIFVALLISAGLRSSPGVMILPMESEFGWGRDTISLSAAIGIFFYGLAGPFSAAAMQNFGLKRTVVIALLLMAASTSLSLLMTKPWHLVLTWGVASGMASGAVAPVLGATIVNRWFVKSRGLVMGILTASTATGTLIFLPVLAALAESGGWRPVAIAVAIATLVLAPVIWLLVPERPSSIGHLPWGADPDHIDQTAHRHSSILAATFGSLARAVKTRTFWFLFATFYICGFTTNGLIGTHLIAFCGDVGIPEVKASGLLATMGIFDLIGTTLSGWLTDRFDSRKLLFTYYALRGLSLIYLPFSDFNFYSLSLFAVFYGLDWIATVPPTLRLATEAFGDREAPLVFGWVVVGHQIGAASAAYMAGLLRQIQGNYFDAFIIAGCTGVVAAFLALMINSRASRPRATAAA
ncbi:MFS transporter [Radicibacter daui]|uniref:MFS transporter n=1 Tax=Radicibacter daui TaxID=3064829 RepID=UPI004046C2A8